MESTRKYQYSLALLKRDCRTNKVSEMTFNLQGPFQSVRQCYLDASKMTNYLGRSKTVYNTETGYEWMLRVHFLLMGEIEQKKRLPKFHSMTDISKTSIVTVIMRVDDI